MVDNFTNASVSHWFLHCSESVVSLYLLSTFISTYVFFILPLALLVLYLGVQRWRRGRSVSTAAATSHSDVFTYNMAVVEVLGVFGYIFYFCSSYADLLGMAPVAALLGMVTWLGQIFIPLLTCVERYLAVVHPVAYLGLRQPGGVRIRNMTLGCVWLVCLGGAGVMFIHLFNNGYNVLPLIPVLIVPLVVITLSSLSALRVLIRPRPGKVGGNKLQVDQSKQRAVHTIVVILGLLWLKFVGNVTAIILKSTGMKAVSCLGEVATFILSLPNSMILFLLFLHRAGKLPTCKHNTESG